MSQGISQAGPVALNTAMKLQNRTLTVISPGRTPAWPHTWSTQRIRRQTSGQQEAPVENYLVGRHSLPEA